MKRKRKIPEKLGDTPDIPGVYLMKDRKGSVIYIGKAVSLKRRIASYFRPSGSANPSLAENIADFDIIPAASEAEALILENSLIKKHRPKYNVDMKDDKSYPLVKITAEKFPSLLIVREKKDGRSLYFGPFTNVELLKGIIKFIRRYYPVRNCRHNLDRKKVRLCTQYHIGRCSGPCGGKISEKEYGDIVRGMAAFFRGNYGEFAKKLKRQMAAAVKNLDFEKAQEIKKRLFMLEDMRGRFPLRDEKSLLLYSESNVLEKLGKTLKLGKIPYHIEGYDVSNISGVYATAGKVSFKGGAADKCNYRKYRIRWSGGIDDCRMIEEVLMRRFDSEEERKEIPDLILVDGGRGQLNAAVKTLRKMKAAVPAVSLAKRAEDVYLPGGKTPLRLKEDSPELHLLQAVRDEAHRFAVSYHRKLRVKDVRFAAEKKA
ncbi:MAG: excinuclease ABC subunit UvrC [Candidatus Omnitrophica bacterium]|nr:excinuclease ABC subunit UvrC [Candidatus Omnitrophota bacterium]